MERVRIGILGAANIAPKALIEPARDNDEIVVTAVAARDPQHAHVFARQHDIPMVHRSYEALLADPDIDAVYNPTPNGLHGYWTAAALEAGKHVLCEKPFTANAEEAERVAAVAQRTGLVVMEAFHYRYHALTRRMREVIGSGEIGDVHRLDAWFCIPLFRDDIRWRLDLAGGALMDVGCYAVHIVRTLADAEPTVRSARVRTRSPGVDRFLQAELDFADGRRASITASMLSMRLSGAGARAVGSEGRMQVANPIAPQFGHRLAIRSGHGRRRERVPKQPSSYAAQLHAFAGAVLRGEPFPTGIDDAIANMRVIDACYRAAGLPTRQPASSFD